MSKKPKNKNLKMTTSSLITEYKITASRTDGGGGLQADFRPTENKLTIDVSLYKNLSPDQLLILSQALSAIARKASTLKPQKAEEED